MTEHTLWTTDQTAALDDQSDGGASGITTSTGCLFAGGSVVGVEFLATLNAPSGESYTVAIWELTDANTGTLLASKTVSGSTITANEWNRVDFDTPVSVADDKAYRVGKWNSAGRYVATSNYFTTHTGDLTTIYAWASSENISSVVPGIAAVKNGTFLLNSALGFPNDEFNGTCYWVGPVWDDGAGGGTDFAVSGTIPATAGGSLAITADRPVSGTIAGSSAETLAITANRPVSGAIPGSSAAALAVTADRPVSGTIAAHSGGTLALVGSAAVYVRRGGSAVLVAGLAGAVKRGGVVTPFGT